MGGDHIAKDEDLDLTETEMEMVQFVLLSIITKPHTSSSERAHKLHHLQWLYMLCI